MNSLSMEEQKRREHDLLGHMISLALAKKPIPEYISGLKPAWICAEPIHQQIFITIHELVLKSEEFSIFSLIEHLEQYRQNFSNHDLFEYITGLFNNHTNFPSEIKNTCKLLADIGKRRDLKITLQSCCNEISNYESYEKAEAAVLGEIDQLILDRSTSKLMSSKDVAECGLNFIHNTLNGKNTSITTGFSALDELTHGFRAGELVTIAGAPGGGKTTAVTTILENIAADPELVLLVISREMGAEQIAIRHFASLGNGSIKNMMQGNMNQSDHVAMNDGYSVLKNMKIIYDFDSKSPDQIAYKASQVKHHHGRLDIIVIDHIGLISSDKERRSRHEEVTEITWRFKTMARDLNTCVIQVSQINRKYGDRADKTPMLTDLAESSSVEKDSDVVIGVLAHREDGLKGYTELHVLKSRMGSLGWCPAKFQNARLTSISMDEFETAKSMATPLASPRNFEGIR